jgi:hypothetical protein
MRRDRLKIVPKELFLNLEKHLMMKFVARDYYNGRMKSVALLL